MGRPRRKVAQVEIAYFEIGFTNNTRYRISGDASKVWEIEDPMTALGAGIPVVRGPITIEQFIALLEKEKESRHGNRRAD